MHKKKFLHSRITSCLPRISAESEVAAADLDATLRAQHAGHVLVGTVRRRRRWGRGMNVDL